MKIRLAVKNTRYLKFISFFCYLCLFNAEYQAVAQASSPPTKIFTEQYRAWWGYMTTARISKKLSIWNDFHFVRQTFTVLRTGLMTHLTDNTTFTAGYGYLILPISVNDNLLNRKEHRPWAQLQTSSPLHKNIQLTNRIRYDFRNVQKVGNGELSPEYISYHRLRFLVSFRYRFHKLKWKEATPFINLADEVLLNFGREILYNQFDQNRISLTMGIQFKNLVFQTGYMYRFVQQSAGNRFINNHLWIIWANHTINLMKKDTNK
ncbi:MAG: hypothetical protein OHK0057_36430 [Thermoflexibacter sp.]